MNQKPLKNERCPVVLFGLEKMNLTCRPGTCSVCDHKREEASEEDMVWVTDLHQMDGELEVHG